MKMDITSTIISVLGVLGFIIAVFGLWYQRREVNILKHDSEKKRNLEKTSKKILQAISIIEETTKTASPNLLDAIQLEIQNYIQDHRSEILGLTITITPEPFLKDFFGRDIPIKTEEDLINLMWEYTNRNLGGILYFKADPDILQNKSINLNVLLSEIRMYYIAYKILIECEDTISSFDYTIVKDVKQFTDGFANLVFKAISNKHELKFSLRDLSSQISKKLNDGIVYMDLISDMRMGLSSLCYDKLVRIQKEMYKMAS